MNAPAWEVFLACSVSADRHLLLGSKKDEANPALEETLLPVQDNDVLEFDEMWSYVLRKVDRCWLWIAICRRTRQVFAFVLETGLKRRVESFGSAFLCHRKHAELSVFFGARIAKCFQNRRTAVSAKRLGRPCHVETCRQKNARSTRKTLSFSKTVHFHELVTRLFVIRYNLNLKASLISYWMDFKE